MTTCSGNVFQIQRWSIHDGEGVRSTVFFKGCPLRCRWCANPESWKTSPEVLVFAAKCTGCGQCAAICKTGAATSANGNRSEIDREKCTACFACCEVCLTGARKRIGMTVTVDDVMQIVKRDAVFYRESGGGVTFSGGEPFSQPHFLRQLATACTQLGIDTAVETSGYFDWDQCKDIIDLLDCVFIDCKHMDSSEHQRFCGVGNERILANIAAVSQRHPRTIVRVPLIAEVNAKEQNIARMCEYLVKNTRVAAVELLGYHDLGEAKYNAAGAPRPNFTAPDAAKLTDLKKIISGYGIPLVEYK